MQYKVKHWAHTRQTRADQRAIRLERRKNGQRDQVVSEILRIAVLDHGL